MLRNNLSHFYVFLSRHNRSTEVSVREAGGESLVMKRVCVWGGGSAGMMGWLGEGSQTLTACESNSNKSSAGGLTAAYV